MRNPGGSLAATRPTPGALAHVVLVEDNRDDAELVRLEVARMSPGVDIQRCDTEQGLRTLLSARRPDVVVSDFSLPSMDGLRVLDVVRSVYPTVPFVLVSGDVTGTVALEALHRGADDYVMKDRLERLPAAVRNALERRRLAAREREAVGELERREERWRHLVLNGSDLIAEVDDRNRLRYVSPSLRAVLGEEPEAWSEKSLLRLAHPDDVGLLSALLEEARTRRGTARDVLVRFRHSDRSWRDLAVVLHTPDYDERAVVLNARDVTDEKRLVRELAAGALYDELTGLPNWALLVDLIDRAVSELEKVPSILVSIDLDQFRLVNEAWDHLVGDQVLGAVAGRLGATLAPGDVLARAGGDTFVALLGAEAGDIGVWCERLRAAVSAGPYCAAGSEVHLTACVGGVVIEPGATAATLLRDADVALHEAKRATSGVAIFDEATRHDIGARVRLVEDLRQAVASGDELRMRFQPKVDLDTGEVLGAEALVRWQHPVHGLLGPAEFIELAEQHRLIIPLGEWVLRQSAAAAARWRRSFPDRRPVPVAVNVSGVQLSSEGFLDVVVDVLRESGLAPSSLCLEITESLLVEDAHAIEVLHRLRGLGVGISVDDFGTGYSSLKYLSLFPLTEVKIDRAFVSPLPNDPYSTAIVSAITQVAHAVNLLVVAEGVETEEQAMALRDLGVGRAQGYLWAHPLTPDDFDRYLGEHAPALDHPGPGRTVPPTLATPDAVIKALRGLLTIEQSIDAASIVEDLVGHLGGELIEARAIDDDVLPVDVSLGLRDRPTLVRAPAYSVARLHLETFLPGIVEDARQAVALLHRAERLVEEAETDPLTGLPNRRIADRLVSLLQPGSSVAVVDLDHFKAVNDTYGHDAGDEILSAFAATLRSSLRGSDQGCRIGGEEFLVIFPTASAEDVDSAIERLRSSWAHARPRPVTFSAGLATVGHDGGPSAVHAADRALYTAKHAGRDRVVRDTRDLVPIAAERR